MSSVLDALHRFADSRANYLLGFVTDATASAGFFVLGSASQDSHPLVAAMASIAGGLYWTFLEYVMHRWLLHARGRGPIEQVHRRHHNEPRAWMGAPFFSAAAAALIHYALLRTFLPVDVAAFFVAGGMLGYFIYGAVHHAGHNIQLEWKPYTRLCALHEIHHRYPDRNFGITTHFWDRLFGTDHQSAKPAAPGRDSSTLGGDPGGASLS